MSEQKEINKKIAIIGGGISGLAAAHRIVELSPQTEITLFEAADQLGGVLQTSQEGNFLVEHSADNFITNIPWGTNLCHRLGIDHQLQSTNEKLRKAFVVCRGRLEEVPQGFLLMAPSKIGPILKTPILSWAGKLRLAAEYFVPRRKSNEDESLKSFVIRRLGKEAYERLVQPLIGGIYTADPEKLSIQATLKQFVEMEQQHGCLIRGMQKKQQGKADAGARYSIFVAPEGGMAAITKALVDRLPTGSIRLQTAVNHIETLENARWKIHFAEDQTEEFDGIVCAAPAPVSAKLLNQNLSEISQLLAKIPYAGCSIAILGVKTSQIKHPPAGFGFVVPEVENRKILAASFSSNKFPGRAEQDEMLIRVFIGGACQVELGDLPDDHLLKIAREELAELIGLSGEPILQKVTRWTAHMPQYHLGHVELVEQIFQKVSQQKNLEIAGNAYQGVGVPQCIHSGEAAAERLVESITS